uniref:Uncharacterized protein n=1 Tax=Rhizophora mucronata TaxID=61149 RepID=A0A2P2IHC7_RHIMU
MHGHFGLLFICSFSSFFLLLLVVYLWYWM